MPGVYFKTSVNEIQCPNAGGGQIPAFSCKSGACTFISLMQVTLNLKSKRR